jgi:hypothetical protein
MMSPLGEILLLGFLQKLNKRNRLNPTQNANKNIAF